jgi:hypothetical protein
MNVVFDTLKYAEGLREAGLDEKIAKRAAEELDSALRQSVATRSDLEAVEARLGGRIDRLGGRIDGLDGKLDGLKGQFNILTWSITGMFAILIGMLGWLIAHVS